MKYQSRKSSCGPAALMNALEAIGIKRTEDELSILSKQSTTGTSQGNLEKALTSLGVEFDRINEKRGNVAAWAIGFHLRSGNSVVIIVDEFDHWISVVGILGDRYILCDSADNDLILFYSEEELLTRWECSGRFYGVIVRKGSG